MSVDWELRESGPSEAARTVLLLPGGLCGAGSFAELMAQPALAGTRLVAATLPGHAGASPLQDCSVESYAQHCAELADKIGARVVVGFSMGATAAVEMVVSGGFAGPVVLLGISLSAKDEPVFFHAIIGLGSVLGSLPARVLAQAASSMVKRIPVPSERQAELREDLHRNVPRDVRRSLREYARWLRRDDRPAERLCQAGVPTWIVHAEKGDGGLTDDERRTLEGCEHIQLDTIPGAVFFLPVEVPQRIAEIVVDALACTA